MRGEKRQRKLHLVAATAQEEIHRIRYNILDFDLSLQCTSGL